MYPHSGVLFQRDCSDTDTSLRCRHRECLTVAMNPLSAVTCVYSLFVHTSCLLWKIKNICDSEISIYLQSGSAISPPPLTRGDEVEPIKLYMRSQLIIYLWKRWRFNILRWIGTDLILITVDQHDGRIKGSLLLTRINFNTSMDM